MAEQQQQSKVRLHCGQYLGEVSALCFLQPPFHFSSLPFLIAGSGSQILLFELETGKMIRSFHVFEGIRVHGITCSSVDCTEGPLSVKLAYKLAVFGEKRVKLFSLTVEVAMSSQAQSEVLVDLNCVYSLPRFNNWVLDVCFLKGFQEGDCLAMGCGDNSVLCWNVSESSVILEVQSPDRCLLYSMRLWGDNLEPLHVASGTIYNEIIVWKVVSVFHTSEDQTNLNASCSNSDRLGYKQYEAVHICRLVGHEGSIFRLVWSSDGSKLVSVSDDRCARIWAIDGKAFDNSEEKVDQVLFGHNARVWDCCISDSLIVTAGEDCTCRVWGLDGKQLKMIKEHIGRGIWRCLYDKKSSLLVTAGFDSGIKVHLLHKSLSGKLNKYTEENKYIDTMELSTIRIPNSSDCFGLMDSKSEYVRCLWFTCEDTIYVASNHGYLYCAQLSNTGHVKWTKIVRIKEGGPIVCMDLLPRNIPGYSCSLDDWVALGDGQGNMTIVSVTYDVCTPKVDYALTWNAGLERQLLGTFWCRSLGSRYVFTAYPRGILKLWRLSDPVASVSSDTSKTYDVSLIAEFSSCFGARIMCLDASFEEEVLVCGDLRGNLVVFPLLKDLLLGISSAPGIKISPINYFKGAHGISNVSSLSLARLSPSQLEICSTGGDGCICYLEYDRDRQTFDFIGMRQVKELSLIQFVAVDKNSADDPANLKYVGGFMSTDFILWNLTTETKVVQISCGGWRRPHSFHFGDVPEMKNCFAYVKDEVIYVHRQMVRESGSKIFPRNLHIQFHGREMHSLCFVSGDSKTGPNVEGFYNNSSWIATGCEDGTVRLTRYTPGTENWSASKLLGEHVGGSAVRSICFVSKLHIIALNVTDMPDSRGGQNGTFEDIENPFLLISVGAKRVLTSWLLRNRRLDNKEDVHVEQQKGSGHGCNATSGASSSMSFQWLSTDMPTRHSSACGRTENVDKKGMPKDIAVAVAAEKSVSVFLENEQTLSEKSIGENYEDDWRYLAVTSFLVKWIGSRLTICFVVVACSDATLALRALILPHRLWFDVAFLVPLSSLVLTLQHVVIPMHMPSVESVQIRSIYVVISGATDGTIAFWDLTESVEAFMRQVSSLHLDKLIDCQKRPRTGRGSQGGRRQRSLSSRNLPRRSSGSDPNAASTREANCELLNHASCDTSRQLNDQEDNAGVSSQAIQNALSETSFVDSSMETSEIHPLVVLSNVHQSGVNCLHVSHMYSQNYDDVFLFNLVSGGDDQALHSIIFDLTPLSVDLDSKIVTPDTAKSIAKIGSMNGSIPNNQNQIQNYRIRFFDHHTIAAAHSSAIKGVWTDGIWVFSTGLDQRIRCWLLDEHGKPVEHAHTIICVPEPEALDARVFTKDNYQIAVAGRGMQIVQFFAAHE